MQVNSVSSNSTQFGSKADKKRRQMARDIANLSPEQHRMMLDRFASMSDKELVALAKATAAEKVNDKRHDKISNAMLWSIPALGGLATATGFDYSMIKPNKLRSVKLGVFANGTAKWGLTIASVIAAFGAKDFLEKHIDTVKRFSANNPIISALTAFVASYGIEALMISGINKIAEKVEPKIKPKHIKSVQKFLNENKVINKASELAAKVPVSVKGVTKSAIGVAPFLMMAAWFMHGFNHSSAKMKAVGDSYVELKQAQNDVRTVLVGIDSETDY